MTSFLQRSYPKLEETPDSRNVFIDAQFERDTAGLADSWARIGDLYPNGKSETALLPEKLLREQFEQGDHFECCILTALSVLINQPEFIRNCFVTKAPRQDGRYVFQFFRYDTWVRVEIDDRIPLVEGDTMYIRSPTKHWWALLLEKAIAKFYVSYTHLEGCTLQEALHDMTGGPVINVPLDPKLAAVAGANVSDAGYWLDLSKKIKTGHLGVTALTKKDLAAEFGMRDEQTYSVHEIVSINGSSELVNLLVQLYCPFEEDVYTGPMREDDSLWTPELKAKLNPSRKNVIFIPLMEFTRIVSSMQVCYLKMVDYAQTQQFRSEWIVGATAGGNPTFVSWRHNPMFLVQNNSAEPCTIIAEIRQEDQRETTNPDDGVIKYVQCGLVLSQTTINPPVATKYVCGNNHKSVHKGLFLNSREVANSITVPANSLCYLVPSAMQKVGANFSLGVYKMRGSDYSKLKVEPVNVDNVAWDAPAIDELELQPQSKDRVDFYVDEATVIHILLSQTKKFATKSGGDNMTEDFCGMYLYNDADKKIDGVTAATNFREISLVRSLPNSGRYAISVTCPKGSGKIPVVVTIVGSAASHVRIVDAPDNAKEFGDSDDDDDDAPVDLIDYEPRTYSEPKYQEAADSNTPFEDRQFYLDNQSVTEHGWVRIGELYPEGKAAAQLLPPTLALEQFEQGDHFECCVLTALGALVTYHPQLIQRCFLSKKVRQDGRYAFQFFRYGQWVVVEIDDRIPVIEGRQTVFLRSSTKHWWPLLLEKAIAKFYHLYANLEGCSLQEILTDMTGLPVLNVPLEEKLAAAAGYAIEDPAFFVQLDHELRSVAVTALTRKDLAEQIGMRSEQTYALLGVALASASGEKKHDAASYQAQKVLVHLYCPYDDDTYTGPMNSGDLNWTKELNDALQPSRKGHIFMPMEEFLRVFASMQICQISGVVVPCYSFHSAWDAVTAGGNPIFTSWRNNPLYVVRNTADEPIQVIVTIRQPDQRATLHAQGDDPQLKYIQCGMVLSQSSYKNPFATHLVTANNHRSVHRGLFLNSREVSNLVTVPARSLCYLVPSSMQKGQQGRFLLSYYVMRSGDEKFVSIRRHKSTMALDKPATDEFELMPKSKDRVDFLVDCPTEVHILLHQAKPHAQKNGGDNLTEDYCGMYLYNDKDQRIAGVSAATNYRDTGLVFSVPKAGRYAISVTCPRGNGTIPVSVTITAKGESNVRITDPPEDAKDLFDVDLSFLDQEPEGVPLDDLPLFEDKVFLELLDKLKALHKAQAKPSEIQKLESQMNVRVHQLARAHIALDRPKYLTLPKGLDLASFAPLLDDDEVFTSHEVQRYALKQDPRNVAAVKVEEGHLNQRAVEIAKENEMADLSFLGTEVRGIPIAYLLVVATDPRVRELDRKRRMALRSSASEDDEVAAQAAKAESTLVHELVDEYIRNNRKFLDPQPRGVALASLPIDHDEEFRALELQRYQLLLDPKKNAAAIAEREGQMKQRCLALADAELQRNRSDVLQPEYRGIAVELLPLSKDAEFTSLERKYAFLKQSEEPGSAEQLRGVAAKMNERVDAVALAENEKDRAAFLDKQIDGVPLSQLPLNTDESFQAAEARRARLKRAKASPAEISAAEKEMTDRARELAKQVLNNSRGYLRDDYEGIPSHELQLDRDESFKALEAERFRLLGDPTKNAQKIKDKEKALHDRARDLAKTLASLGRAGLRASYGGIPVEHLGIESDDHLRRLEIERRRGATAGADVAAIDDEMHQCCEDIAAGLHQRERGALDQRPLGVPIALLDLDKSAAFVAAENHLRQAKRDGGKKDGAKIKEKEADVNKQLLDAARAFIAANRKHLDQAPLGVSLSQLPLDTDKPFLTLEYQLWIVLLEARSRGEEDLSDEDRQAHLRAMNQRCLELATTQLRSDRAYLEKEPEGVPMSDIDVDGDDTFRSLESERSKAKGAKNAKATSDCEQRLNARARQLTLDLLAKERLEYDQTVRGIPQALLNVHGDKKFRKIENERRAARHAGDDESLRRLSRAANDRLQEVATAALLKERAAVLRSEYEGVPYTDLPLDTDSVFSLTESKRYCLGHGSGAVADDPEVQMLTDEMHYRAEELAKAKLSQDRAFLDPEPRGVLLEELPLDTDQAFNTWQKERQQLKKDNKGRTKDVEAKMNDRCHRLASELLQGERTKYLQTEVEGVSLTYLPLDSNKRLLELESARWKAKRNGEGGDVEDSEQEMQSIVEEMAKKFIHDQRIFLEPEPEGVPLALVGFDRDKTFKDLEVRRWKLCAFESPKNAQEVQGLEAAMVRRTQELARELLIADRGFYDPEPEGVPLSELALNTDKIIAAKERHRQRLKGSATAKAPDVQSVEDQLNDRAAELALVLFEGDRAYLDPEPEGVALSELPLNSDEKFRTLEIARRRAKKDPSGGQVPVAQLEEQLNARTREMARQHLVSDRSYLDPEPHGVLLEFIPLNGDKTFRDLERQRSKAKAGGRKDLSEWEEPLQDRCNTLAKELIAKERSQYLKPEYVAVPVEYLPLDDDAHFRDLEKKRRMAKRNRDANASKVHEDDLHERATELAHDFLEEERSFLDQTPEGVPLKDLTMDEDKAFRDWELERRKLRRQGEKFQGKVAGLEARMNERVHEMARQKIAEDRAFLNPAPLGVPLEYLPLDTDKAFNEMEAERRFVLKAVPPKPMKVKELEDRMNDLAHELARVYLAMERDFLSPEPEGVPLQDLQLDRDKPFLAMELERRKLRKDPSRNVRKIEDVEQRMKERTHQLAQGAKGFEDADFHSANRHVSPKWARLSDLYPEGRRDALLPERPSGADVESGPDGSGFLAPYLAAMTRNFPLYHQIVETKVPSRSEPMMFQFHSPQSGPVKVAIDDRIPVGDDNKPLFTRAPNRHWYPMLIEKAYAKFRGGYRNLDFVTPHEVLRDLTGRPVTHIPLESKLARASGFNPAHPKFWRGIRDDVSRGDIVTAMSLWEAPDGIHRQSSYAIMAVVDTIEGSDDPSDTLIRLHCSYRNAPHYHGPMHKDDPQWTPELLSMCKYDRSRPDSIFLPIPVFIRNFVSLQKANANSGDPITHSGEWDSRTSGGNPNSTSFRHNPIFVMENCGSRSANVILELRHTAPQQQQGGKDSARSRDSASPPQSGGVSPRDGGGESTENEAPYYPQTGVMVLLATTPITIPSELLCLNAFRPWFKSIILDSRDVAVSLTVPPTTTCFVVPYTMRRGVVGKFDFSLYPFQGKFHFHPLQPAVYMKAPLTTEVNVAAEHDGEGHRLDFLLDDDASEIHILAEQTLPYDSGKRGNLHASNELQVTLFDDHDKKVASSGDPADYRELAVLTRPVHPGRYAILLLSPPGKPPQFPVTISVYASRKSNLRWIPMPPNARSLIQTRFPALPKSAPLHNAHANRHPDDDGNGEGELDDRRSSLPLIHREPLDIVNEKVPKEKVFKEIKAPPRKPKPPPRKVYAFGTSSPRCPFGPPV